jgi:hypothetical protein
MIQVMDNQYVPLACKRTVRKLKFKNTLKKEIMKKFNTIKQFAITTGIIGSSFSLIAQNDVIDCTVPIEVGYLVQNPACHDDATGSISLKVQGGTPYTVPTYNGQDRYVIDWDKDGFDGETDLENLPDGQYTVSITDSIGCTYEHTFVITSPDPIVIEETHVNPTINTSNGEIDITVTGGTGAYTYVWSNEELTEDITGLVKGEYTVTVTDANRCTAEETITLQGKRVHAGEDLQSTINSNLNARDLGNVVILYPNPSPGSVMITWGDLDVKTVRVLRNDGFVDKFKKISDEQRLEINDLPTGAYRVYLSTFSGATITRSLQVMN